MSAPYENQKAPDLFWPGAFVCMFASKARLQGGARLHSRSRNYCQAGLLADGHSQHPRAAFGPTAGAAALVAGLFVILAAAHLFFDPRVFDQLTKSLHSIRNRFMLAQTQLDHEFPPVTLNVGNGGGALESPCW